LVYDLTDALRGGSHRHLMRLRLPDRTRPQGDAVDAACRNGVAFQARPAAMANPPDGGLAGLRGEGSPRPFLGSREVAPIRCGAVADERPRLSVVIPCYNEELRLPRTIERIERYLGARGDRYELILVDDGSG